MLNARRRPADPYLHPSRRPAARLDQTAALAASALDFPFAQINIVDDLYAHTISSHGYDHPDDERATPRLETMCGTTVMSHETVAIDNLRLDDRSRELPAVVDGRAASYLGVPVHGRENEAVGTLCVFDTEPHAISPAQRDLIAQYAVLVEDQLESMRRASRHDQLGESTPDELAGAIADGRIVPWYQPIVDLGTGRTVGLETLARWQHDDGRVTGPDSFVPLAEESDLVLDLDRAVLQQALVDLAQFRRTRPELRISVNFSVRHFEIHDGVAAIHSAVLDSPIPASAVTVEITESRDLADFERARVAVQQLRLLGYGVVLDDFGTGFSSPDWILRLPVSGVKIDRSVTQALGTPPGIAIARAIGRFADQLGLSTVIEGIDAPEQARQAADLGLGCGQGYLWSPPRPAAEIAATLA